MPSRIHFTDVPVWVTESEYARFMTPTQAAKVKDLTVRDSLECVHGRKLAQKCYQCRSFGMGKEDEEPPKRGIDMHGFIK